MSGSDVVHDKPSDNSRAADEFPISWPCCLPFLVLGYAVHTQTHYCPSQLKGMFELLLATCLALFLWLVVRGFLNGSKLRSIDILGFNAILLLTISNAIVSTLVLHTIQQGDTQCTTLTSWERPLAALSLGLNFAVFEAMLWLITTGLIRGIIDWDELRSWALYKSHNTAMYPWVLTATILTAVGWAGSDHSFLVNVKSSVIPDSITSHELESALTRRSEDMVARRRAYQTNGVWLDLTDPGITVSLNVAGTTAGMIDGNAGIYDVGATGETYESDVEVTISWGDKFYSVAAIRIGVSSAALPDLDKAVVKHDGVAWTSQSVTNNIAAPNTPPVSDLVGNGLCTAGHSGGGPFGWYGGIQFTIGDAICGTTCQNDPVCVAYTTQDGQTGTCYVYCIQEHDQGDLSCTTQGNTSSLAVSSRLSDTSATCRKMERSWAMIYRDNPNNEETYSSVTISLPRVTGWNSMEIGEIGILAKETTLTPSSAPSFPPTVSPSQQPTESPSPAPTNWPTDTPTTSPTESPTNVPTHEDFYHSDTVWVECSNNVEEVECYHCYDGHNSIFMNFESSNAELSMESNNCPSSPYDADGNVKDDWINCEGNWTIRAAATMYIDPTYQGESAFVMWDVWEIGEQTIPYHNQTDGRLDVDQEGNSTDWRRYYRFTSAECKMDTPEGTEDCYLPKQVQSQDNVIACTWKIPKKADDGRTQPIIWSWGDSLAMWHSWRPELNYEYKVMNFTELEEGLDFTPGNLIDNFLNYIIIAVVVFVNFLLITCFACTLDRKVESEYDYSLDTRTYKTVYDTSMKTRYYYNVRRLQVENKFICWKHGPYVLIVLFTGIVRAVVFTFLFCSMLFHQLNKKHIDNLSINYPIFAGERDHQLLDMHYNIEELYEVEFERMQHEYDLIRDDCSGDRMDEMQKAYDDERTLIAEINDLATSYENIKSEYASGNSTNKTWAFLDDHPCIIPDTVVSYMNSITETKRVEDTGDSGPCSALDEVPQSDKPTTRAGCEQYFCYWKPSNSNDPDNSGSCVNALTEQQSIDKFDESSVLFKVELECRNAYWCMGYSYQRVNVTSWLKDGDAIYSCIHNNGTFLNTIDVGVTTYYRYELSTEYDGYCSSPRNNIDEDYTLFLENFKLGLCYYCVTSNEGVTALAEVMDEPNYYLFEGHLEPVDMYGLTGTYINPTYGGWCYEHEEGFSWPANLEEVAEETEHAYEDAYVSVVETEIRNFNDLWNAITTQSQGESCRFADGWVAWEEMSMCVLLDDSVLGGTGNYNYDNAQRTCMNDGILTVSTSTSMDIDYPQLASPANVWQLEHMRDYCYLAFGEPASDSWCYLAYGNGMFGGIQSEALLRDYFNYTKYPEHWGVNSEGVPYEESFVSFDSGPSGQPAWTHAVVKATGPGTNIILSFINSGSVLYNGVDPVRAMCINGYENSLLSINTDPMNPYSISLNTAGWDYSEGFYADIGVFCPSCPDSWSTPTLEAVDTSEWTGNSTNFDVNVNNDTSFSIKDTVNDVVVTPGENFTYTINTDLFDMPLSFTGLSVDLPVVISLFVGFDALMLIYRITVIAVMVTDLIIGRDKEVSLKYLSHGKATVGTQAREVSDKICWGLGACLRNFRNMGGVIWYLIPYIFKLCMLVTLAAGIVIVYIVMDQVVTTDVLSGFGAFEAMTMGITVHRAVRNEQIAIRALYINEVSIPDIEDSLQRYADSLIVQTYQFNTDELDDVNSFNSRFCPLLRTYLYTPRDLSNHLQQIYIVGGNDVGTNGYNNIANQGYSWSTLCTSGCTSLDDFYGGSDQTFLTRGLTDGNTQTYWQPAIGTWDINGDVQKYPSSAYTVMILEFSAQTQLGDAEDGVRKGFSFFEVTQLVFTWGVSEVEALANYRSDHGPSYDLTPAAQTGKAIQYAYTNVSTPCDTLEEGDWLDAEYEATVNYDSSTLSTNIKTEFPYVQSAEISTPTEAKCVKISWKTEDWGANVQTDSSLMMSAYMLQEVSFYGRLPLEKAADCPRAVWTEMRYVPSEFNESCEVFTPVHGFSMNEFVRDVWSDKLTEEHDPYIMAIRSILLSPFFIVLMLVCLLIVFYMLGGMIEMILLRSGLIRENPYAKIRCVLTHETYVRNPKRNWCACFCCPTEDDEPNYPLGGHYELETSKQRNIYEQDKFDMEREISTQKKMLNLPTAHTGTGLPPQHRLAEAALR